MALETRRSLRSRGRPDDLAARHQPSHRRHRPTTAHAAHAVSAGQRAGVHCSGAGAGGIIGAGSLTRGAAASAATAAAAAAAAAAPAAMGGGGGAGALWSRPRMPSICAMMIVFCAAAAEEGWVVVSDGE